MKDQRLQQIPTDASPDPLKPKRAVAYIRVSTRRQAERDGRRESLSIPAQRQAIRRKASELGALVVKELVDRGRTGTTMDRPELQRMLSYLRERLDIDFVLVHKIDRLARSRSGDVEVSAVIGAAGARLVSTFENIDETPAGMLLHGIWSLAELAQHLVDRGLCSRRTPHQASRPITKSGLQLILTNPYYRGLVRYAGRENQGSHPPLAVTGTWQRVQTVLNSHCCGERTRAHLHNLKSSIVCAGCGRRLIIQLTRGKSGRLYPYFTCRARICASLHRPGERGLGVFVTIAGPLGILVTIKDRTLPHQDRYSSGVWPKPRCHLLLCKARVAETANVATMLGIF